MKKRNNKTSNSPAAPVTKERKRQNGGVLSEVGSEGKTCKTRYRARFECVLDAYLWQGILTRLQYEVGLKFYREYARSVLRIKTYDTSVGNAQGAYDMTMISAINGNIILKEAFMALSSLETEILISVCVENYRAGGTRRLKVLTRALDILSKEWSGL